MFKKTNKQNFRRQRRTSDDEQEREGNENDIRDGTDDGAKNGGHNAAAAVPSSVVPSVAVNKVVAKSPSPPPKTASLLSFDAVEEGDDTVEFKVKKSSESRRLEKFQRRMKKEKDRGDSGEEAPSEMAKAPSIKQEPRSPINRAKSPIAKVDFGDVMKQERKDEEPKSNDPTWNKFRSVFTEGGIPDAQAVYRARKQREKARVEGDSYIPLEDDTQRLKDKGEVRSRLVREDDNDASDEETGRFYSARSLTVTEEERRRTEQAEFLAVEQGDSEDDSDDELARWEQEQIRKGISAQQISAFQNEHNATNAFYGRTTETVVTVVEAREPEPMEIEMEMDIVEARKLPKAGGGPSAMVSKAPTVSIEDVIANLRNRLADGELHMNARKLEKEKLANNLAENTTMISNLEMSAPRLQQQYTLYQEMRVYSRNLLECLDETIGKIDELEDSMMGLLKNRADYLVRRRRQDVRDQYDECSAAAAGRAQSLVRTPDVAVRAAEREARRGRRRLAREKQLDGVSHHEGMSSDEEETPSQIAAFKENYALLTENAKQVFAEALEEYSSIDAICERIVHWLAVDAPSFEDAFIEMCIPKLLSPIIRLQLIDWNPLAAESPPLETMPWYTSLLAVGSHSLDVDKEHSTIVGLIPAVIEKVILPKLTRIVSDWWDPCSLRQSRNLSALLVNLVDTYPTLTATSKTTAALLTAISQKTKAAVDDDLFMPVYQKDAIENSATGARAFLDRQFWVAVKVIKCLLSLDGILSTEAVQEQVVDGVINRNIVLGLQCSSFTDPAIIVKCKAVFNALPSKWFKSNDLSKQLESLCKVFERIAEQQKKSGSRDAAKDLTKFVEKIRNKRDRSH